MKKSELKSLIKEMINESAVPKNHYIKDGYIFLKFDSEAGARDAIQYYSSLNPRMASDTKSFYISLNSIIRFLVNTFQNNAYNPE